MIRPVKPSDAEAVLEIWNPVIRDTVSTFNSQEKTHSELLAYFEKKERAGEPFFVAVEGDDVLGFATYGPFRGGVGYRHTFEHTVMVAPSGVGRGVGRALLKAVEFHVQERGAHSLMAGVSGENEQGIRFHKALGYQEVARVPEVGRKFDRWFDLVLLQKRF